MLRMNTGYTVADVMTRNPVTISPDKNLRDAAKLMDSEHVGALLIKEGDRLVGILSEQDIVRKGLTKEGNTGDLLVSDIMENSLTIVSPIEDIFEALRIMREENFRHLPVMHEGEFLGLVTMKDILKVEPELYEILVEKIELREIERKPIKKK